MKLSEYCYLVMKVSLDIQILELLNLQLVLLKRVKNLINQFFLDISLFKILPGERNFKMFYLTFCEEQ